MSYRRSLTTALTLALLAGTANAQIAFSLSATYPTPSVPDGMANSDFDMDGDLDLAIATDSPPKITLLFNNFNGTFASPVSVPLPSGSGPDFVRATDMNGDGFPDLIVTLRDTSQVMILLNDGHAVFTVAGTFPVGANPRWLMVGPLHGGASNDIVVANRGDNTVTVLLHQTGMNFTSTTYPVSADPRAIARADVNGDGFPELFVSSFVDRNFIRLTNDGAGHFTSGGTVAVGADRRPNGIFASDLNHDGKSDIIVANTDATGQGFATVFLNSNGTFPTAVSYPTLGQNAGQVASFDLDRDGHSDLVVVNANTNNISTLRNTGNGTFETAQTIDVGASPRVLAIGDFDQDYIPDMAVTNLSGGSVSVLINMLPSPPCYANFDGSTAPPILNTNDFQRFMTSFTLGESIANCDGSTVPPVLNVVDFNCFINLFAAGCS